MERSWPSQRCSSTRDDGGEQGQALNGKGDVGEVGDGAVAVLEVEGIQKLFGALGIELFEGLAHR